VLEGDANTNLLYFMQPGRGQKTFPRTEIWFHTPANWFPEPTKGFAEPEERPYERVKRVSRSEKRIQEP
jgi:hypothetical protein